MATLNDDFDDDGEARPLAEQPLTWQWSTWPANLRTALVVLVCTLAGCAGLIALARWADKDLTKQHKRQNELLTQAKAKLLHSDQERRDIEVNLPLLRQLEASNIFGEEKRLEWVELLRTIEKRWPGVRIQFTISAQSLVPNATPAPGGAAAVAPSATGEPVKNLGVFKTDMRLTLRLLHEGDALAIIQEVKEANLGYFNVSSCSFKRPSADTSANVVVNQTSNFGKPLEAECLLTWTSMRTYAPT